MGHYFLDIQYKDCFCIADSGDQVPEQEEGEDRDPHLGVRGPGEPKSQLKAGRIRDKQSVDQQCLTVPHNTALSYSTFWIICLK